MASSVTLEASSLLLRNAAITSSLAFLIYSLVWILRRLVFHPLARFPGPKLAALTSLYEDYYEIHGNYDYIWQIKKMHARYGPIVRINPHEIHIHDPSWYPVLNSFKGRWDKDPHTAHQFANPHSSVGTVDHDTHRRRKAAVQPFFAKQKIYELEPAIVSKALKLCARLAEYRASSDDNDDDNHSSSDENVVPMRQALKCFCVDTIAEYCFAKSGNMLDKPDFALEYWRDVARGLDAGMRARYLPRWVMPTVRVAPAWIRASLGPGVESFELWHRDVQGAVDHVEAKADAPARDVSEYRTIFHELLNSAHLSAEDKVRPRLVQEGAAMIGAGGETTSQILGNIVFGLLEDSRRMKMLREELKEVQLALGQSVLSLRQLEGLPYLTGCLKEGLRLRTGKIARQQRVPMGASIFYNGIEIKPGTICSMTPVFCQIDPDVFPEPHSFRPERWVGISDADRSRMEAHMVPYSKGTRMCTGMSLANAMMYIGVAALALELDMELYETTAWDNEMAVDSEKHSPLKGSKGLRVVVKPRRQ